MKKDPNITELLLIRTADGENRYIIDKTDLRDAMIQGENPSAIKASQETEGFCSIDLDGEYWAALDTYSLFRDDYHSFLYALKEKHSHDIQKAYKIYPGLLSFINGACDYEGDWTDLGNLKKMKINLTRKIESNG